MNHCDHTQKLIDAGLVDESRLTDHLKEVIGNLTTAEVDALISVKGKSGWDKHIHGDEDHDEIKPNWL